MLCCFRCLWGLFHSCPICYAFLCLGQDDYQLPLPLLFFRHLNSASIRDQRILWCWPAGPHRDNKEFSLCCTNMTIRYPLLRVGFCPCIFPHGDADLGLWHLYVLFLLTSIQVDSQELQSGLEVVYFSVTPLQVDSAKPELFCCLYKSKEGHYSAFSPYLQPDQQTGASNILFVATW